MKQSPFSTITLAKFALGTLQITQKITKSFITTNRIYLHEIKRQGRRRCSWAALAAVAGGVLGVRWSSLSSSSGGIVVGVVVVFVVGGGKKSELEKNKIFEYLIF